jgi:hypothetical protein
VPVFACGSTLLNTISHALNGCRARVICRNLLDTMLPHQISTAVTYVGDVESTSDYNRNHGGCAHDTPVFK